MLISCLERVRSVVSRAAKFAVLGGFAALAIAANPAAAQSADLVVNQADSPDPGPAGGVFTYTIRVDNNGPDAAVGVNFADTLPPGSTFVGVATTQGTCSPPAAGVVNCALGGSRVPRQRDGDHPGHPAHAWRLHEHRVGDVGHDRSQHVEQPQRHRSDDGAERHRHGAGRRQPGRTGQRRHRLQLRADGDQQRPAGGGVADDRVRGSRGRVRHVRADRHRLGVRAGGGLPAVRGADHHLHAQHVARVRRERAEPDGPRRRQRRRFRHRCVHREFAAARRQFVEQHGHGDHDRQQRLLGRLDHEDRGTSRRSASAATSRTR